MQQQEVATLERLESVTRLGVVVRVEETGGARHLDPLQSCQPSQPVDQVDRRDDRALDAEALLQCRHHWTPALSPEPYRGRRRLARRQPRAVDRMPRQTLSR